MLTTVCTVDISKHCKTDISSLKALAIQVVAV